MIDSVEIAPLKQICDERGKVMHMLRSDDPVFKSFGEIYFSCVYPGAAGGQKQDQRPDPQPCRGFYGRPGGSIGNGVCISILEDIICGVKCGWDKNSYFRRRGRAESWLWQYRKQKRYF